MSQQGLARRSASHGALSSSYTAQGRASSDSGHQMPTFRPLRSIREHTHTFLDPAASVDGMLRKTTETGNIGIFSISNTTRPQHQLHPKPAGLRARASLNDLRPPPRPFSRSSDRPPGQDDRRHLPSYRDSTSEIISMYGSENHSSKSLSSSLTTPCDDLGQRSYSLTTCGSRGYFMPRSNGPQQPREFQGRGQRPRSPYPYPTRLPRPGIRPSSPALTENGDIDYRRMVAINRVSHRTTHHPHKTLFPYKTTRNPLPLSLRQDANESTRSFSEDRVTHRLYPSRPQYRPPLPSHLHEWDGRPRQRMESGSSVQSLRTMSLTSLSGGYGYAPPRTPGLLPTPKKPLFYDYSEDFDDATEPPPVCPIAPIPKRVSHPYRPANIQNSSDTNTKSMDEAQNEFVAYLQEATMSELPEGDGCHGNEQEGSPSNFCQASEPVQTTTHNPAVEHNLGSGTSPGEAVHVVDFGAPAPALGGKREVDEDSSPEDLDHTRMAAITELASDSSTLDDPPDPETPAFTTDMPSREGVCCREDLTIDTDDREDQLADHGIDLTGEMPKEQPCSSDSGFSGDLKARQADGTASLPYMSSNRCHDSRFYSLGSGLSDLASFVNQVDRHFQTPGPSNPDHLSTEVRSNTQGEARDASTISPLEIAAGQRRNHEQRLGQDAQEVSHPPRVSSLRQHRRHNAELHINTGVGEPQQYQVVSTRSGPTLVPQPISPAKLLRVKNSIPQLMKALPPLPGYAPAPESPFGPAVVPMEFEPFELSRLTDARSTLSDAIMSKDRGEEAPNGYDAFVFDRKARKPKLKLKHAASFAHEQSRNLRRGYVSHDHEDPYGISGKRPATATEYSTAPVKRRLPIKVSRPTLTSMTSEDSGTVKRRPGFQKSSTVSELASSQPVDLFTSSAGLRLVAGGTESAFTRQISPEVGEQAHPPVIKVTHVAGIQKVPVDDAGPRGSSLDAHLDSLRLPNGNETAAEGEMHSFFSDNSLVKPQGGLRKRISDLRLRLADSRHHHRSPLRNMLRDDNNDGTGTPLAAEAQSTNTFKDLLSSVSQPKAHPRVAPNRRVRSKLENFLKGAKHRLRIWGKAKRRID